jgi:predicted MFS family arabinose efflux permease
VLLAGEHDARDLGLVLLSMGIARGITVGFGGWIGDRYEKRLVMLRSDAVRFVLSCLLAVVVISPVQSLWVIMCLAVAIGLAQGIFLPSSFSIVPTLVDRKDIVAANAIVASQQNLAVLLGPALGGLLVAGLAPGPVLLIDACTFLVSAACLYLIRPSRTDPAPEPEAPDPSEPVPDPGYRAFLRYVMSSRLLRFSLLNTFVVNLGYAGMVPIALPAMARVRFDEPAVAFGFLLTGTGIGALIGGLVAHSVLARRAAALIALTAGVVEGVLIMLVPLGPGFAGSWAELFGIGIVGSLTNVFFVSALQRTVPSHYLGRTMSLVLLASFATSPVSYGLIALLVSNSGPTSAFLFTGVTTALAFGLGFLSPTIRKLSLREASDR